MKENKLSLVQKVNAMTKAWKDKGFGTGFTRIQDFNQGNTVYCLEIAAGSSDDDLFIVPNASSMETSVWVPLTPLLTWLKKNHPEVLQKFAQPAPGPSMESVVYELANANPLRAEGKAEVGSSEPTPPTGATNGHKPSRQKASSKGSSNSKSSPTPALK